MRWIPGKTKLFECSCLQYTESPLLYTIQDNKQLHYQTERFAAGLWYGCPCQSGSVHGWIPERGAAHAGRCHDKGIHDGPETPPAYHHDGQCRSSSWTRSEMSWRLLKSDKKLSTHTASSFLPILGLDAQPVSVAASAWPEADAGERGEGLQTTGDDGLLTGGWQDNTTQYLAFSIPQHKKNKVPVLGKLLGNCSELCNQLLYIKWTEATPQRTVAS